MQRSGQCKCGAILTFEEGPSGYKGRCPKCGAVVRLRVDDSAAPPHGQPPQGSRVRPPRPSDPRLSVVALREPGPAEPGGPDPDATTPFEPVDEVVLEPWVAPPPAPPSFLTQYRTSLVVGVLALIAGGLGTGLAIWLWFS
jgi:hypothetical protein